MKITFENSIERIAEDIVSHSYSSEIIELIKAIDKEMNDSDFTLSLQKYFLNNK
jgi:hypothetical protein